MGGMTSISFTPINTIINISFEGYHEYLDTLESGGEALGVMTADAKGFGVVTITLTASATNAETVTAKAIGLQIGDFTWVPLSWILPPYFKVNSL